MLSMTPSLFPRRGWLPLLLAGCSSNPAERQPRHAFRGQQFYNAFAGGQCLDRSC